MQRILITGGAGYLGAVIVPRLLQQGHEVTVIDNFMFSQNPLAACCQYDGFNVIHGDCRDDALLNAQVKEADVIIPLAAIVGAPMCDKDPVAAETINARAIETLCGVVSKHQRIIMPVSNSGYGVGEDGVHCDENSRLKPISLYGRTKVRAEEVVLERENSLTFRLATVFGMSPRMRLDLLVNDFVHRAVTDRALVIFEGHFKRNYIHVQDVARAFEHAILNFEDMKGRPYNVGLEDANLSKVELARLIQKYVPEFTFIEAEIGEDPDKRNYIVSNQRILSTGFAPEWTLDAGIREIIKGCQMIRNRVYGNV